ncbi:site-2 protease family protein [Merismopedia glauca]|uniref:Site-2 protease family protein n=1 Tax=Merismopedia glauca CCAP 1448/3 TaxID=1296344 RepID=A0A2T1C487_9CYAN|nr:site-2 protease family protein [Merismopedia glauca]PSB03034.1 site-2 protease family protein [Merismopedia glauca CCAP 1448/3]
MFIETLLTDPLLFIRLIIILVVSITIHELAHGIVALSQGDNTPQVTGHMTLNPVVHMGWESLIFLCLVGIAWGQMPVNPSKFRYHKLSNILVSAAGPVSNLGLASIGIAGLYLSKDNGLVSQEFLYLAAQINITLCLFNLLPIPPLDGFHICSEIFPGLKWLENSYFGLFAMMIIWITGIGTIFFVVSQWIICKLVPTLSVCSF